MAGAILKESRRKKRNVDTNEFLTSLNCGALTFGQPLASLRQADEAALAQFAATLGISRQHLHQLEPARRVSARNAQCGLPDCSNKAKAIFYSSPLQDLANNSGITASVQVNVA